MLIDTDSAMDWDDNIDGGKGAERRMSESSGHECDGWYSGYCMIPIEMDLTRRQQWRWKCKYWCLSLLAFEHVVGTCDAHPGDRRRRPSLTMWY